MIRICSLDPSQTCEQRAPQNNVQINKCGECAYDPIKNVCTSDCGTFYIRNATTGACQLAPCSLITPNRYFCIVYGDIIFFFFL
jgi:hypothetical protein